MLDQVEGLKRSMPILAAAPRNVDRGFEGELERCVREGAARP
jgi:hypothetical protein